MQKHVLILGAGFAGLELASRLSESLADEVRVTLIDRNDSFGFGFSKLDLMFGRKAWPMCGSHPPSGALATSTRLIAVNASMWSILRSSTGSIRPRSRLGRGADNINPMAMIGQAQVSVGTVQYEDTG